VVAAIASGCALGTSSASVVRQEVRVADVDARSSAVSGPHIVFQDRSNDKGPLLIFLTGTGGLTTQAARSEQAFIGTALARGYRFLILSYIDAVAISQICTPPVLAGNPDCAGKVRQRRSFGDAVTPLIDDTPQDAIVYRIATLLQHLAKTDAQGSWERYLDGDHPRWDRIVLAGQSQGGGMAAFIAKRIAVGGVIDFSGGWDMAGRGRIAAWYSAPGATAPERLYGTYHVQEKFAKSIAASYGAMHFPAGHQFALDKPLRNPGASNPGHGEGAANPVYKDVWEEMLDRLNPAP
jgi:hypothetical protein